MVLVLLALVSGLVLPRMAAWLSGAEDRAWRGALRSHLAQLPVQTYREGRARAVDASQLRLDLPMLPPEVKIDLSEPLRYADNGLASGGRLQLRVPGHPAETWQVLPITGEVRLEAPR